MRVVRLVRCCTVESLLYTVALLEDTYEVSVVLIYECYIRLTIVDIYFNFFNFDFTVMCAETSNIESKITHSTVKKKRSREPFLLCVTVHTVAGKSMLPSAYPHSGGMYE